MCCVIDDFIASTVGTWPLDDLSCSSTLVTRHSTLSVHPGEYLLFHKLDSCTIAAGTRVYVAVGCGSGTSTVVAKDAFLDHKLWGCNVNDWITTRCDKLTSILAPLYMSTKETSNSVRDEGPRWVWCLGSAPDLWDVEVIDNHRKYARPPKKVENISNGFCWCWWPPSWAFNPSCYLL